MDPTPLAQALIACASVTPADAGALGVLGAALGPLGHELHRVRFGAIDNLVTVHKGPGRRLAFAGHSDVVPPGDASRWRFPPFDGVLADGRLYGRGAADMKGALAAWVAAEARWRGAGGEGATMTIFTGDEEGAAVEGTAKLMPWLAARDFLPDAALVGEPTSAEAVGDTIKIGRRGSLNAWIEIAGVQGHVAYPARADNPITKLVRVLARLKAEPLDGGTDWFEPSNLEITRIEGGEAEAGNVIPARARARVNIRFNDLHSEASLTAWLHGAAQAEGAEAEFAIVCSGEAFRTDPGELSAALSSAAQAVTGRISAFSTGGGTSDARFIRRYCPVVELGLVGATMHQVDENVPLADLETLTRIYHAFLVRWFA